MGDFSEHVLFGLLVAVLLLYTADSFVYLTGVEITVATVAVFIGSILPDIDHKKSYIHRAVKSFMSISSGLIIFFLPLEMYLSFAMAVAGFLVVYAVLSSLNIRHRGVTHSISFAVTVSSLAVIVGIFALSTPVPGLAMGVGIGSHLLLDQEFKL